MNQLFLVMKITTLLIVVGCLHISAASLSQTVSIKANKWSIAQVFDAIRQQTDYQVVYSDELIDPAIEVSLTTNKMPLEAFLAKVLKPLSLTYQVKENTILIGATPPSSAQPITGTNSVKSQPRTVSGKITDELGNPLAGVTVRVKGTALATTTNNSGTYEINVQTGEQVLSYSLLGFEAVERAITNQSTINVSLKTEVSDLDEVVVVGYETVKRRDLTAAVSSVNANDLRDVTLNSAEQALTGRLAGVQVTTAEGSPDAEVNIVVRGGGSITQDNSPLYIVDGVQVEDGLRSIAPQDIERIDVLKDASATAIYGSRGANGVVLVVTKSGKAGMANITYNGFAGLNQLPGTLEVMSPYEFVVYQYERNILSGTNAMNTFRNMYGVETFADIEKYKEYTPVDWQRQVMGNDAWNHTHNVSISGGTNTTKYNISYTHNNTDGIVLNTDYLRNLLSLKLDQALSEKFNVGVTVRHSTTNTNGAGTSDAGNAQLNGIRNFVKYKPYLEGGEQVDEFDEDYFNDTNQGGGLGLMNPVAWSLSKYRHRGIAQTTIGANLRYDILPSLSFTSTGGVNRIETTNNQFNDVLRSIGNPSANIISSLDNSFNVSNVLTFTNTGSASAFAERNEITALLGKEIYISEGDGLTTQIMEYPRGISAQHALNQLTQGRLRPGFPVKAYNRSTLLSFFGRANYTFDKKYLLSLTLRADGSSKFSADNRWGYFPSGSFAWRLSDERFMEGVAWVQDLKLRFTYGTSGNNRIPNYAFLSSYTANSPYGLNNSLDVYGYQSTYLANPGLRWETTTVQNLGLDFSVLKNRLRLSVDLYNNHTEDVITSVAISPVAGYTSQLQNTADTRNRGLEIQLSAKVVETKKFSWNADVNVSFNSNRINALSSGLDYYLQSSGWVSLGVPADYIVKVGEAVGSMWGYAADGYYTVDDFNYDPATTRYTLKAGVPTTTGVFGVPQPGSVKVKDLSGNGTIGEEDKQIIGVGIPKGFGGINQQFTLGNFDASVFVNFSFGGDVLNGNKVEFSNGYLSNNNLPRDMENRWKIVDADGVLVQRVSGSNVTGVAPDVLRELNKDATLWQPIRSTPGYFTSSWAVEDGSFIRINNITIGYNLESELLKRIKFKRLRLYVTANNVAVFTRYTGYDPEVNTRRATGVTPGVDYSAYPRARNFIFGANFSL